MDVNLKIRVVLPGGTKLGVGRARLLRLIDSEGSIRGAVQEMGMSYRAAWGYLRELEEAIGFQLLDRSATGARLTPAAREFLAAFDSYVAQVNEASKVAFKASFDELPESAQGDGPEGGA